MAYISSFNAKNRLENGEKNLASQSRSYKNWALTIKKTSKNALIF